MVSPSRLGNKRYRVEPELSWETENKATKRASRSPASTPSPQSVISQHRQHLSSQHIPRYNPDNPPIDLSKFKTFSKPPILSLPAHRLKQPQSTSSSFASKFEPTDFFTQSQLPTRPTVRSTTDSVIDLLITKSERENGEEIDTQLSLCLSSSSSNTASSSRVDSYASPRIDTRARRGCMTRISELGIPRRNSTSSISKLRICPSQLITPMKHTYEHKIELLRQQSRSETANIVAVQRETLDQARIESLRRESLLKEHLNRNKILSPKAEDLLSQSLSMGRFSVPCVETGECWETRSKECLWSKNQMKEQLLRRSFEKESIQNENLVTRYLSNSRREFPAGESWWNKKLQSSSKQNPVEAEFSSVRNSFSEKHSVALKPEIKLKEKMKELGEFKIVSEELGFSREWSRPNCQKNRWSLGEIDLSLGLQTPSTSSQIAEN